MKILRIGNNRLARRREVYRRYYGSVAQSGLEQRPFKPKCAGSNPVALTNGTFSYLIRIRIMKKECKKHGLCNHSLRSGRKNSYRCRQCAVEAVSKRCQKLKIMAIEYKGGKCYCGYNKCVDALEFHHLDPSKKEFTLSGMTRSWKRIKKELDKCILVCSNCHKEIEYGLKEIEYEK